MEGRAVARKQLENHAMDGKNPCRAAVQTALKRRFRTLWFNLIPSLAHWATHAPRSPQPDHGPDRSAAALRIAAAGALGRHRGLVPPAVPRDAGAVLLLGGPAQRRFQAGAGGHQ